MQATVRVPRCDESRCGHRDVRLVIGRDEMQEDGRARVPLEHLLARQVVKAGVRVSHEANRGHHALPVQPQLERGTDVQHEGDDEEDEEELHRRSLASRRELEDLLARLDHDELLAGELCEGFRVVMKLGDLSLERSVLAPQPRNLVLEAFDFALDLPDAREAFATIADAGERGEHQNRDAERAGAHRARPANTARPGHTAAPPSSSSMRRSWLYFAVRSLRASEPVLIWPALTATARSAMNTSSVSPERCEMTVP